MATHDVAQPPKRWRWESLTGGGAILQEDSYRRLWLGRLFSHTPLNAVLYTMLVLAVGQGSGQSIKSALFIVAYLLPTATLGTVSGVLVDRLPKNIVLAAINIARASLMLFLIMGSVDLWTVYLIALLLAMTSQFAAPAEAAALPMVVRSDQLTTANSTNNFGGLISQIIGFAVLPAFFLNTIGPKPLFVLAGILFGISAIFFFSIHALGSRHVNLDEMVDAVQGVRHQFAEGWQTLSRDVSAYMSVIIVVLASTASLVAVTLMPQFTSTVLNIEVQNSIFVFLPAAAGVVVGLRLVHLLERRVSRNWVIGAGFCLLAASFLGLAMTVPLANMLQGFNPLGLSDPGPVDETTARIFVTVWFSTVAAFSYSVVGVSSRALVNERMPVEMQGRIFAAQVVLTNLASVPPILFAGVISEVAGVPAVMILTVFILVGTAGWALAQAMSREQARANAA
jgi:MFS family permease